MWILEMLARLMFGAFGRVQAAIATQDRCDRAGRRYMLAGSAGNDVWTRMFSRQRIANLAPTPGGVIIANRQNRALHILSRAFGTTMRATRPICQTGRPFPSIPVKPFVAGLTTDAEPFAKCLHVGSIQQSKRYKLVSERHSRPR